MRLPCPYGVWNKGLAASLGNLGLPLLDKQIAGDKVIFIKDRKPMILIAHNKEYEFQTLKNHPLGHPKLFARNF